ncbi:MAG: L-seryl-tRNA(Sec) selenium transferase [Gluconacetobacter diazotrophicus]|nr:L-seryl-tRNA(Sec) selenium transferase [Gluconacetobacter diazotrophicus]
MRAVDGAEVNAAVRRLPALGGLLDGPDGTALAARHGRARVAAALRAELAAMRDALLAGDGDGQAVPEGAAALAAMVLAAAAARIAREDRRRLRRVINATGVVLHTNLGRAPLADAAADAVREIAAGYCDLELDLDTGRRGRRFRAMEERLATLVGTEDALAVNNTAAAMLLALAALAAGGEVVVSRGELVEIGGGFRIPDVITQGGARLVEVGTTNRTRIEDYRRAIGPDTRVLLKVHRSNYRMVGFTEEVAPDALRALAEERNLVLLHDLGSGAVQAVGDEPTVGHAAATADLVAFSGDKLFGGPQAGILVGKREAIAPLRKHPLLRAVRLDKLVAAALEATAGLHADPERAREAIPALRMLHEAEGAREERARTLAAALGERARGIVDTDGRAGGGTMPAEVVPSRAVALDGGEALARALRLGEPAVMGRLHEGRLLLDVLAVAPEEVAVLAEAVARAMIQVGAANT